MGPATGVGAPMGGVVRRDGQFGLASLMATSRVTGVAASRSLVGLSVPETGSPVLGDWGPSVLREAEEDWGKKKLR
jgi:hypothetical protein